MRPRLGRSASRFRKPKGHRRGSRETHARAATVRGRRLRPIPREATLRDAATPETADLALVWRATPRARDVKIEDYDLPELMTENGIADVGFALMAWIVDPRKNALAIMELKG